MRWVWMEIFEQFVFGDGCIRSVQKAGHDRNEVTCTLPGHQIEWPDKNKRVIDFRSN